MYKDGIVAKAVELGYSQSNICILKGDINELRAKFPVCYDSLMSCCHNKDKRTPIEYAQDLVASWIFEDTLVQKIAEAGLEMSLAGTDKNREILPSTRVSSCSDCIVSTRGQKRRLEIMSDYTGWWERMGQIDLRDEKYYRLSRERSLFLGICTIGCKYILFDFAQPVEARYIAEHRPYGGKPAYSIQIKKTALKHFSIPSLVHDLIEVLNAS